MDRRRRHFVPSSEGLEDRQLLSVARVARPPIVTIAANSATAQQKLSPISKLPNRLLSLQEGRTIPASVVASIQTSLLGIVGKLDRPATATLDAVNQQYRSTLASASISIEDAAGLRATFVNVLKSGNAPQGALDALTASMDKLVQVDSVSRNPAILAAGDYAVVLQTALQVGRPIKTPGAPSLSPSSNTGSTDDRVTTVVRPKFVGRYTAGTTIQLLNEDNVVLGTAEVDRNGQYNVSPTSPLRVGAYKFRVRAFDSLNNFSKPSRAISVTIKAQPPQGPLRR